MKRYCLIGLLALLFGCATAQSYTKPGVNFSNFKKIAVIKFDCPTSSAAQEVSDIIGLEFIKRGFHIIERSQLRAIVTEEELIQSGLIESNRSALKISGVNAIIVGSVSRYDCHPDKMIMFLMGSPFVLNTNNCHASVSLKMLDVQTGDIIWAANGAHSMNDVNMTANKVLVKVLELLKDQIPHP